MARMLLLVVALAFVSQHPAMATVQCTEDHAVIDGINVPYSEPIEITGSCVEPDRDNLSPAQADLQAVRINDRGNQDQIIIHLNGMGRATPPKVGQWYRVHGRLNEGADGGPVPQFSMVVEKIEAVPAAPLAPADFVDRPAEFEGIATDGGRLKSDSGSVRIADWPAGVLGKHVGVRGVVKKEAAGYRIDRPDARLLDLPDLAGKAVTIEGTFFSLNDVWRFMYRDQALIVTDAQDHPVQITGGRFGNRARVTGRLVKQLRPSLDQVSLKEDRDLVPTYVLRRANIEFTDPPGDRYGFSTIYPDTYRTVDGVPELLASDIVRRSWMGESPAQQYAQRNRSVIDSILRTATPETFQVLAKRMGDASLNSGLRLVYAAMLAAANDSRGRTYLEESAGRKDKDFRSTLFCLGVFPYLMPDDARITTDASWAERLMIRLMIHRDAFGSYEPALDAVESTAIPDVLVHLDTPAARTALMEAAAISAETSNDPNGSTLLWTLRESKIEVSHDDLLRLASLAKQPSDRRSVLRIALRENDAAAAALFFNELGDDNWFAQDIREHLSPEIAAELRNRIHGLRPKAQSAVRILIILSQKDPAPDLIALLSDPAWTDKTKAIWELAQTKDPRAAAPAFKILKAAAPNFFHADEYDLASGVKGGIEAIANASTKDAVADLIELLSIDLTRFSKSYDREGYRRIIAAHLIDITGESFGTDAAAWKEWNASPHQLGHP